MSEEPLHRYLKEAKSSDPRHIVIARKRVYFMDPQIKDLFCNGRHCAVALICGLPYNIHLKRDVSYKAPES